MAHKPKLSSRPPNLEEFLAGPRPPEPPQPGRSAPRPATKPRSVSTPAVQKKSALPWERAGVRDDVIKPYNLRLPEAYLLKLKFIAEHSPQSMQRFCLDALLPAIDGKIRELTRP